MMIIVSTVTIVCCFFNVCDSPTISEIVEINVPTETLKLSDTTAQAEIKTETITNRRKEQEKTDNRVTTTETIIQKKKMSAQPAAISTKNFTRNSSYAKSLRIKDKSERTFEDDFCLKIEDICKQFSTVGFSLAIFKDNEELYSQVYGFADKEKGLAVDENTKFRSASISKLVTGMLVMKLVSEGKADLDADISDYTGVRIRSPYYEDVVITPRMLMNHSSSIVDGDGAYRKGATLAEMFKKGNKEYFTSHKPGSTWSYTNFGASLLTCVIEKASGQHFVEYSQSAIMNPLGIDAAYTITQIKDRDNVAQMYVGGNLYKSQKTDSITAEDCLNTPLGEYFQISYGNLMISPRDMAKIAIAMSGDGTYKSVRLLPEEAVKLMGQKVEGSGSPWGLMQKIVKNKLVKGRVLIGHNGDAYGLLSCVYYDREDRTGFVYMTNGCRQTQGEDTYAITEAVARTVYKDYIEKL
jgi:CubicO group peptidase (beta-lactamase class C family)